MFLFVLFCWCSGILVVLFIVDDLVCLEILWSLYSLLVLKFLMLGSSVGCMRDC